MNVEHERALMLPAIAEATVPHRTHGILLRATLFVLTLIGTFCRGPYWHFYWPWETWPEIPSRI